MEDPQAETVYRFYDNIHANYTALIRRFRSVEEIKAYILNKVLPIFGKAYPHLAHTRIIRKRYGELALTHCGENKIILPDWAMERYMLIHELAHMVVGLRFEKHGKEFLRTMLNFLNALHPPMAKELRRHCEKERLEIDDKSVLIPRLKEAGGPEWDSLPKGTMTVRRHIDNSYLGKYDFILTVWLAIMTGTSTRNCFMSV